MSKGYKSFKFPISMGKTVFDIDDLKILNTIMRNIKLRPQEVAPLRCLAPICSKRGKDLINAHSISKSRVLNRIAKEGHLYTPTPTLDVHTDSVSAAIEMRRIGIRDASTFKGLCHYHDSEIFDCLDTRDPYPEDKEYMFKLFYRIFLYTVYRNVLLPMTADKRLGPDHLTSFEIKLGMENDDPYIMNMLYRYANHAWLIEDKLLLDQFLVYSQWDTIGYQSVLLSGANRTIACANMVTFDDLPSNRKMGRVPYAVFCLLPLDEGILFLALALGADNYNAMGDYLKRNLRIENGHVDIELLSRMILRDTSNWVLSPDFWESLNVDRRKKILDYYTLTYNDLPQNESNYTLKDTMIFVAD